jgi:hypothetical protein
VYRLFAWGTMPVGALLFGGLSSFAGPQAAFAAGGAATLVMCLPVSLTLRKDERIRESGRVGEGDDDE